MKDATRLHEDHVRRQRDTAHTLQVVLRENRRLREVLRVMSVSEFASTEDMQRFAREAIK